METEESADKKKRPVLWIVLIVLVLVAAVVGWQAKSLLPQPEPVQTPAPVIAKVPPQPPPMNKKAVELTNEPKIFTLEVDDPSVQATEDTTDAIAEVAQRVAQEEPAPTQSESAAPESRQGDIAEAPSMPSSAPDQAADAQQAVAKTEAEPAKTTQPEVSPEVRPEVKQDEAPQASPKSEDTPRHTASSTLASKEPNIVAPLTIQVGAFRTKTYASDKIADLTQRGYEPYIFEVTGSNKRIWYTVRFGEFETRDQAAQALIEFKKKENMDGIISRTNAI